RAEGLRLLILGNRRLVILSSGKLQLPLVAILPAFDLLSSPSIPAAGVAKLVYAPDSKSGVRKDMSVRVRPPAPNPFEFPRKTTNLSESFPNRVQDFHC